MNDIHEARNLIKLGSIQHRVIAALSKADLEAGNLRVATDSPHSMVLFRQILGQMERDKLIQATGQTYTITTHGLHLSVLLGAVPERKAKARAKHHAELFERPEYDGKELGFTCQRRGAYDALLLPSRMGKYRHYPNGRTEIINEDAQ